MNSYLIISGIQTVLGLSFAIYIFSTIKLSEGYTNNLIYTNVIILLLNTVSAFYSHFFIVG